MKNLKDIADFLELECSSNLEINNLSTLKEALSNSLSFFHNAKYLDDLRTTNAGAVILEKQYTKYLPSKTIPLVTKEPYKKMVLATSLFAYKPSVKTYPPTLLENAQIANSVHCGKNVTIGKNSILMGGVFLGDNVIIGENSIIYPNVTIYNDCKIGDHCIIHSGTVIGSDGFGFASKDSSNIKFYQIGNVIIENSVEIGANCAIDRATLGSTIIKSNVKLDNLIQVGHNCEIGECSIVVSQVGLSGSTIIGQNVIIGGQCGTAGHLKIGDGAILAARSGVTKTLKGDKIYGGFPAVDIRIWRKMQAILMKLVKKKMQ